MNQHWLNQVICNYKQWDTYSWIVNWFKLDDNLSRQQLDQALELVKPYKHDQTTTVAKVTLGQSDIVLKRYNARSFGHKLKRALRQSRAQRCWNMSYVFAQAGLNVAAPVFMFEERILFVRKHAYFANQYLSGEELLQRLPSMDEKGRRQVVEALKQAMNLMQEYMISHGDMKASNLLWVDNQLYFIDLDAARQHKTRSSWLRSNKRDRKRFLKNWRDMPELEALFTWLK